MTISIRIGRNGQGARQILMGLNKSINVLDDPVTEERYKDVDDEKQKDLLDFCN